MAKKTTAWADVKTKRLGAERVARVRHEAEAELATLKAVRVAVGTTQAELAERSGIGQPELSRIESGQDMRLSTLRRYAEGLGATLEVSLVVNGKRTPIEI